MSAKKPDTFPRTDGSQSETSKQLENFKQSDSFRQNRFFWSVFGLWPGKIPEKYYKFFSFTYLFISYIAYNALLTLNLYYTPRKIETLIQEVIFFFTEIAVGAKLSMILFKRKKIAALFEMLDRDEFKGSDEVGRQTVIQHNNYYKKYLLLYTVINNTAYFSSIFFPVIGFLFFGNTLDLPVCQCYFLTDEMRNDYFISLFLYQNIFLYGHMMYNVNIHTFIVGFMGLAIGQVKVLCHDLENLKIGECAAGSQEKVDLHQQRKLRRVLNHYELLLESCDEFQDLIDVTIFVQYGIGSATMCVIMCGLLVLPSTAETQISMVSYFIAMNLDILIPAWLGTQLTYESAEIMTAAYKSEWLPRSKRFKSSIMLLVERAKTPVILTGLNIFTLSLDTYIQIMKAAYSCFTLLLFFQDREKEATT